MPLNGERGFSMVEILVVLLITAILAGIGLPLFLNQRAKAQDADAKAVATVAASAFEVYHQEHEDFAGATAADLEQLEPSLKEARGLTVGSTVDTYTIKVASGSGNGPFTIERKLDDTTRTCGHPGEGGCPDSGEW
jgi:prepilin-type N-terminal cleavage/methylation domain-containing protein